MTDLLAPTPEKIRAKRIELGLTQAHAARLIHLSVNTWHQYESGKRTMHLAFWELFTLKSGVK